jgi:hypothetical protein
MTGKLKHYNSDGQQFYQYQQTNNHFSPRTIGHKKTMMTYGIGNPRILAWDTKLRGVD